MIKLPQTIKLPFAIFLGSLILIITIAALSSPVSSIFLVGIFFLACYILFISSGILILRLQNKQPAHGKQTILLVSTFLVIALMFRSARALSLLDALLLLIFSGGIFFYLGRR